MSTNPLPGWRPVVEQGSDANPGAIPAATASVVVRLPADFLRGAAERDEDLELLVATFPSGGSTVASRQGTDRTWWPVYGAKVLR